MDGDDYIARRADSLNGLAETLEKVTNPKSKRLIVETMQLLLRSMEEAFPKPKGELVSLVQKGPQNGQ